MSGSFCNVEQPQRLPWLKKPAAFTDNCTQCGLCIENCPTNVIEQGSGGFPTIDFSSGECTFCYQCAEVCPEPLFMPEQSTPWNVKAVIDQHCLAVQNIECRSCNDNCEPLAIQFTLQRSHAAIPAINTEQCTGCGACVNVCPTSSIRIKVTPKDGGAYVDM
nr:ferredoxin-type protein NapF [Vibrio sinus]